MVSVVRIAAAPHYSSFCLIIFIEKYQSAVIRILLLDVAKIIKVYSKANVECDCNRMRQNVVCDCVQIAK